jgi:hypothetical protein
MFMGNRLQFISAPGHVQLVTSVTVEAWGGGGSGSSSTKGYAGGGGGGGAYSIRNTVAVTVGTTYTITVGSGGYSQ